MPNSTSLPITEPQTLARLLQRFGFGEQGRISPNFRQARANCLLRTFVQHPIRRQQPARLQRIFAAEDQRPAIVRRDPAAGFGHENVPGRDVPIVHGVVFAGIDVGFAASDLRQLDAGRIGFDDSSRLEPLNGDRRAAAGFRVALGERAAREVEVCVTSNTLPADSSALLDPVWSLLAAAAAAEWAHVIRPSAGSRTTPTTGTPVDTSAIITENCPFFLAKPRVPSIGSMIHIRGPSRRNRSKRRRRFLGPKGVVGKLSGERLENRFLRCAVRAGRDRRRGVGDAPCAARNGRG